MNHIIYGGEIDPPNDFPDCRCVWVFSIQQDDPKKNAIATVFPNMDPDDVLDLLTSRGHSEAPSRSSTPSSLPRLEEDLVSHGTDDEVGNFQLKVNQ